ncbi:MAG: hypothetical protein U0M15_00560 [Bacillota bacterium]|nr:hypothetical protein [Bacillota bacterium]
MARCERCNRELAKDEERKADGKTYCDICGEAVFEETLRDSGFVCASPFIPQQKRERGE